MKILLVQDMSWERKGPWQQHHLMEKLSLKGHEIRVVAFEHQWRWEQGSLFAKSKRIEHFNRIYQGAEVVYIRPSFVRLPLLDYFSYLLTSRKVIKKEVAEFNPEVIISFTSVFSSYWGMRYARQSHIPFVYYWYDIIHVLNIPKPFGPLALLIEKRIIKRSTLNVTISAALTEYLLTIGAIRSRIETIPGGVDLELFNSGRIDRQALRERYGFAERDTVLFFLGWIFPFSGLKEVTRDIVKLADNHSNIRLLVVGQGPGLAPIQKFVKQQNAENRIILTGYRPYEEMPELIAAADICLLPAHDNEVMRHIVPIKMYEYLAMGKPVICTKLRGVMKEFGRENGVIYVDNPDAVVAQAVALNNNQLKLERKKALDFIKGSDWELVIADFEAMLSRIVRRASDSLAESI